MCFIEIVSCKKKIVLSGYTEKRLQWSKPEVP